MTGMDTRGVTEKRKSAASQTPDGAFG